MVRNQQLGSGSGLEPIWNSCNGLYSMKRLNRTESAVLWPFPQFHQLRTLASVRYLGSDHITIRYIRKRCNCACSFISWSPLCDPINIHCVSVKNTHFLQLFHSDSINIDWIAKWRIGGKRACKTACSTYISYCDMIRTQMLNWIQSYEFTKMRLCCI